MVKLTDVFGPNGFDFTSKRTPPPPPPPKTEKLWDQPVYFEPPEKAAPQRRYKDPNDLWEAACKYFEWCENNPHNEGKHFHHEGISKVGKVPRNRVPTVTGLCVFLGVSEVTFCQWGSLDGKNAIPDLYPAVQHIRAVIRDEKFTGAAAGVLNANLIARDLALMDRKSVTSDLKHTGWVGDKAPDSTPDEHKAVHVHPDDPDPLNVPRPLYSRAQIVAGIPFFDPEGENFNET
jgi:hypothetical protein